VCTLEFSERACLLVGRRRRGRVLCFYVLFNTGLTQNTGAGMIVDCTRVVDGPGSRDRALEPARDIRLLHPPRRIHWGGVRSSPRSYPRVFPREHTQRSGRCPNPSPRLETSTSRAENAVICWADTEYKPESSPSSPQSASPIDHLDLATSAFMGQGVIRTTGTPVLFITPCMGILGALNLRSPPARSTGIMCARLARVVCRRTHVLNEHM